MTQLTTVDAARNEGAGYKVDVSRGQRIVLSSMVGAALRSRKGRNARS